MSVPHIGGHSTANRFDNRINHRISPSLGDLVREEKLNHLILNLYPNNEGYSIALRNGGPHEWDDDQGLETMRLSYEEDDLLTYIDNEELPPVFVDLIESSDDGDQLNLFYSGCIIVRVRDYRRNAANTPLAAESRYVLLKPTNQTIINDVNRLTATGASNRTWTPEEKVALEAGLILATCEPLCLDPSPMVAILTNKNQLRRKWIKSTGKLRSLTKKCSQSHLNKIKKYESLAGPKELGLNEFLIKKKNRATVASWVGKSVDGFLKERPQKDPGFVPQSVDVAKYAKLIDAPPIKTDNSLVKVEEFVMEFMEPERRTSYTCVSIFHRPIDDAYFGQLYVDRNRDQGHPVQGGSSCLFRLGTKGSTKKYIDQFTEILTENGRKSVKIIHQIPGRPPQVSYTPAASASGVTSATKDPLEDENMNLGTNAPKKLRLTLNEPTSVQATVQLQPKSQHQPPPRPQHQQQVIQPLHHPQPQVSVARIKSEPTEQIADTVKATPAAPTPALIAPGVCPSPFLRPSFPVIGPTVPPLPRPCFKPVKPETALAVILTAHPVAGQGECNSTSSEDQTHTQANVQTNVASTLPTGVSLTSLNLTPGQNVRLHNLVQLANVGGVTQGIAVPISFSMMSGTTAGSTVSNQHTLSQALMSSGSMISLIDGTKGCEQQVVLVDASSGTTLGEAITGQTSGGQTFVMSSGPGPGNQGNVLSVPIGMSGSLGVHNLTAQLMGALKPGQVQGQVVLQMNHQTQGGGGGGGTVSTTSSHQLPILRPLAPSLGGTPIAPQPPPDQLHGQTLGASSGGTAIAFIPQQQLQLALRQAEQQKRTLVVATKSKGKK